MREAALLFPSTTSRGNPRRHCGPDGPSGRGGIPQGPPSVVAPSRSGDASQQKDNKRIIVNMDEELPTSQALTCKLKLLPDKEQVDAVQRTVLAYRNALSHASTVAFANGKMSRGMKL